MVVTKAHSGALRRLKWLGPACLLLAAAGIALASHYWYNPRSLPVSWLDPQWGQVLFFGGIPLAIALFSLISPAPAGIIGLFLTLFTVRMYTMTPIPPTPLIPPFVYLPLCGIFVAGCSLQIILGIKAAREVSSITSETVGRIHMAARITTLLTFVCSVIVFFIYPAGAALGFIILGGMALGIAWFWSGAGGVLMVLLCGWAMYMLVDSSYDVAVKIMYSVLLVMFLAGGTLHVVAAVRRRWAGSLWQPLLAVILSVGLVVTITVVTADRHTTTNIPGTIPIPPNIPAVEVYLRVEPQVEAELLEIARADPSIQQLIQAYTRTLSVGGKPYLDEGFALSVGARLKHGVTMAEWTDSGRDESFIAEYVGSLNLGFVFEQEHYLYSFSIDLDNRKVSNLTRVN